MTIHSGYQMTRRSFVQALGLAIAGAIIPLPKLPAPTLFIDDGAGYVGQVLMTDGQGNATWVNPDLLPDSNCVRDLGSSHIMFNSMYGRFGDA